MPPLAGIFKGGQPFKAGAHGAARPPKNGSKGGFPWSGFHKAERLWAGKLEGRHAFPARAGQPLPLAGVNPKGGGLNPLFGEVRRAARCITSLLAFFPLPAG